MTIDEFEQIVRDAGFEITRQRLNANAMRWEFRLGDKVEGFRWMSSDPEVVPDGFAEHALEIIKHEMRL